MPARQSDKRSASAKAEEIQAQGLFSAYDFPSERLSALALGDADVPKDLKLCQEKARYWAQANWFIRVINLLKHSFFDYGFKLVPQQATAKHFDLVQEWQRHVGRTLNAYRRDCWTEFLTQDAVVCLWRENGRPIIWPVERCEYSDAFGEEVLKIRHDLTATAIDQMKGLSAAERTALKRGREMTLTHRNKTGQVFRFDVLKRAAAGGGLGMPGLRSVFTTLAQGESMEVGDNLLAHVERDVVVQWQVGHEIKTGPQAGSKVHFCTEAKAKKVVDGIKGKKGVMLVVTNFDQKRVIPRVEAGAYDNKKFDSVVRRLALWAMPLGQMVLERSLNPYLMPIFKIQAEQERSLMRDHLNVVFNEMRPPCDVEVTWSNKCFTDTRLFSELLKFGISAGALSQRTFRDEAGYDHEQELARKEAEGKLPAAQKEPAYDPAHSAPGKKPAGKSAGTPDEPQT